MALETELKLSLAARDLPRLLAHPLLAGKAPQRQTLRNTYFDTPELELLGRRIAVRERRIGRQTLLTVKTAGSVVGGLAQRGEWEGPSAPGRFDFAALVDPPALAGELQALAGRLQPVFSTDFSRRSWRLRRGGALIELALDRGLIRSQTPRGRRQAALLELELELLDGPVDALFGLAQALGRAAPLRPLAASKAERGYALFLDRPPAPRRAAAIALAPDMTPLQAFRRIALDGLAQLQANEAGLLQRLEDTEYLHQARVALRRLRSALRLFAPVLPAPFVRRWGRAWQGLAQSLGEARDWDVLCTEGLPRLIGALGPGPAAARLERHARAQRAAATTAARASLAAPRHAEQLLSFTRALLKLPETEGPAASSPPVADWARERLASRQRKLRRSARAAAATGAPDARHALRIELKKLRYALDFLAGLYPPKRVQPYGQALAAAQDLLGRMNDWATAQRLLAGAPQAGLEALPEWIDRQLEALAGQLPEALAPLRHAAPPWKKR